MKLKQLSRAKSKIDEEVKAETVTSPAPRK